MFKRLVRFALAMAYAMSSIIPADAAPTRGPDLPFTPETGVYKDSYAQNVPVMYDITQTQVLDGVALSSYWASSFLTGSNGHQYVVIAHALLSGPQSFFRGSLLDITTSAYSQFVSFGSASTTSSRSKFNVSVGDGGYSSNSADNVSVIQTWSTNPNAQYNLTFEATSATLYNGGVGQYIWGPSTTNEWALPACKTTGVLHINGSMVTVDEGRSLTWYDRQWNPIAGRPFSGNWTWLELHLGKNGGVKVSLPAWDSTNPVGKIRFATVREPNGDHIVTPVTLVPSYERTYTSRATNITYPLDWEIISSLGEKLSISSHVADQELVGPSPGTIAYEGFVTAKGSFMGAKGRGYGIVEMVHQ